MKKRWVTLCMALILSLTFMSSAYADNLSKQKDKLEDVQDRIEELEDKISDVKDEKKDILGEIDKIQANMDKLQDEINDVDTNIQTLKKEIKKTNEELEQSIEEYNDEKKLHEQRLQAMYMNGPTGYLEILFTSKSFADFITNADMMKKVIEYDKGILVKLQEKQKEIETKKESLKKKEGQLASLQKSLESKKITLEASNKEKQSYYQQLKKDEAALRKALEEEEAESKRIEQEIRRIMEASKNSGNQGNYSGSKTGILKVSDIGKIPNVTSQYGWRVHPVLKTKKFHSGMDIGVKYVPVYAMSSGKVIISKQSGSYGNYIVIDHGGGISSLYAHLSQRIVSVGQTVEKGQKIAVSGNTGRSTGPHLHFEVRKNGSPIDPNPYYIVGQ